LQSLTVAPNSIALPPGGLADVISRRELENVRGKLIDALRSEGLL